MNTDGSNVEQLTENTGYDAAPVWSPDGNRIAFISKRGERFQLFTMDLESGEETQLTDLPSTVHSPAWSPSGEAIAFISDQIGSSRVLVLELESGSLYLISDEYEKYAGLSWVP
jgi:TolB protein